MSYFFQIIGIIGMLLISGGILKKKETSQDWIFVAGGLCLLVYSIYLKDPIFIPLQIIFIGASLYELHKLKK